MWRRGAGLPMMTGVEARNKMKVSTLQYCSVLMFVKMQPRKAHDTKKKLWHGRRGHG